MAKNVRPSRLNPVYLLGRHAGTVFLFLALGLLCGVAFRSLVQSARYSAEAEVHVRVVPPERAESFDRAAKQREWSDLLSNSRERALLGSNLRHALKLAATADAELEEERLQEILSALGAGESFSSLLFANPYAARLGPTVEVTRRDLAANMDFQSLAAIIADLAPATGETGRDFGFFTEFLPESPEAAVIARADAGDPYFRVFFALHRLLKGREAADADEAWKTAADELAARIEREAQFGGGGGFGPGARRELLREIAALPVLAANSLYRAEDWREGEIAAEIELSRPAAGSGTVRVAATVDLNPLRFPRDTVFTRTPPLTVATVLATLAARENRPAEAAEASVKTEEPAPVAEMPEEPAEPQAQPARPIVTYREEVDEAADRERLAKIASLEEALRLAARDREACLRRLNAAREGESLLSVEAMNARRRADRLRERYDNATVLVAGGGGPEIPEEARALLRRRDEITRRLNELLAYCTAEHPFVKAAFREMEAVEATLGEYADAKTSDALADARATRIANIHVEWEAASASADALEERRARQAESVACLVEEAENIEASSAKSEAELEAARAAPVPTRRVAVKTRAAAPPPRAAVSAVVPAPEPAPEPAPVPAPKAEAPAFRLAFAALPADIPLHADPRDWNAVHWGLLCGCLLGILVSLLREIFTSRFATPAQARRLVDLPLLAALPAYDAKSFRQAAATVKGEVTGKGAGALLFTPSGVEIFEPPTEARRGRVVPAKRRPRVLAWICALVMIFAAAFLHYRSGRGFAQPRAAFDGALPLPAASVPAWTAERRNARAWENMP